MAFKTRKRDDRSSEETFAFDSRIPPELPAEDSFIGKTMNIKADITSDGDVIIEGKVSGNINVAGTLTIGRNGNVTADINAAIIRIDGMVKGNIFASDKVELLSLGRHTGNIQSEKLVVEEGAILNGFVNKEEKK